MSAVFHYELRACNGRWIDFLNHIIYFRKQLILSASTQHCPQEDQEFPLIKYAPHKK